MKNPKIVYQSGNTLRLLCNFYDWSKQLIDPPVIFVKFYDYKQAPAGQVSIGIQNRLSKGKYFYDYVTPSIDQTIWYEWYSEIDGLPNSFRDELITSFVGTR